MLPEFAKDALLPKPTSPGATPTMLPVSYRLMSSDEVIQPGDLSYYFDANRKAFGWFPVFNEIYFGETVDTMQRYRGVADFFARYDPLKFTPLLTKQVIQSLLDK